jgi:uncharacterized protein (DUF1697 family)
MSGTKTAKDADLSQSVLSLEERQWEAKLAEIRAQQEAEEREWMALLTRAKHAAETQERLAARAAAREQAKVSGSYPRGMAPPPLPSQRAATRAGGKG